MNPDPRLTAYALGELDPAERETFERELATSPALQAHLQDLIPLCDELMKTLPEETDLLTEKQRRGLRERSVVPPAPRRIAPLLAALAACLALALGILLTIRDPSPALRAAADYAPKAIAAPGPASSSTLPPLLAEADEFYASGRYDLAIKRAEQVLAVDKDNVPARRLVNEIDLAKQRFAALAANATRRPATLDASRGGELLTRRSSPARKETFGGSRIEIPPAAPSVEASAEAVRSPEKATGKAGAAALPTEEVPLGVPVAGQPAIASRSFYSYLDRRKDVTDVRDESYRSVVGNVFLDSVAAPLSTFSVDVDTASYANVRRFLRDGQLPPPDAVRLEELINYFPCALPPPDGDAPFSVTTEVSRAPWNPAHLLARIALKGRDLAADHRPPSNLVFLIDVSGSMDEPDKLPLLKRSLRELVRRLTAQDRVAIVTYAGDSGLALDSTAGENQARILEAIDRLAPGGSTNGAAGIQLAYDQARSHFTKAGNNRVILCTDGDFNVGVTSRDELTKVIERERRSGVFLSVLGFGTGNVKDDTMENLADRGNGNYASIDSPGEGRKVLVEQMGGTLFTIAKDVKIQVEFNPATVAGYRLIGYENRLLAKEDFNDDTKDAGEIGAGHAVTAFYEIVPAGRKIPGQPSVDPLKYRASEKPVGNRKSEIGNSADLFTVKLRSKAPDGDASKLIEKVVSPGAEEFAKASGDFRFASAVAAFGMKLRGDRNDATMDWSAIRQIARDSLGEDPGAYRAEFLTLIEKAKNASGL